MLAIISLLLVLVISFLITRIASSALMHTGLSREVARFQARSALTGAGFTTTESERLVNHPVRRRILMVLMLVGNAGIITAVSSLILAFIGPDDGSSPWLRIVLLVSGLVALWAIATSQFVDHHLSRLIDRLLERYTSVEVRDFGSLLGLSEDYRIIERVVTNHDWLAGKTLSEASLSDEGVLVLAIQRQDGGFRGTPEGDMSIEPEDTLVLYGHLNALQRLDTRRPGAGGERDHEESVAEQSKRQAEEKAEDRTESESESDAKNDPD